MFCPHCGKSNKEGGKFCVHCGKSLSTNTKQDKTQEESTVPAKSQATDPKKIEKWKASVKNAGLSAQAFGWLQIIVGSALLVWYLLDKNFSESGLGDKFDAAGYVLIVYSAIIFIVLGNRIKILKDPHTNRYLYILLVLSLGQLVLSLSSGGFTGIIFILMLVALIGGANNIGRLMKDQEFHSQLSSPKHRVNTYWWIGITVIAIVALLGAAYYAPDRSSATTNTNVPSSTSTWIAFTPTSGDFSSQLPSTPESSTETEKLPDSDVTLTTESYAVDNTYFIYVFRYVGNADFSNPQENLKNVLDGTLESIEGSTLQSSTPKTIGGNQALEFQIKVNTEVLRGLMIARGQTIYEAIYDYIEGQEDVAAYTKFINGFTLR